MQTQWTFDLTKLLTLRELKQLSRQDCARAIGKTQESYRLKEAGKCPITADELCALGTTFGIDPRSFFVQRTSK